MKKISRETSVDQVCKCLKVDPIDDSRWQVCLTAERQLLKNNQAITADLLLQHFRHLKADFARKKSVFRKREEDHLSFQ